jgi:hypothetical protein
LVSRFFFFLLLLLFFSLFFFYFVACIDQLFDFFHSTQPFILSSRIMLFRALAASIALACAALGAAVPAHAPEASHFNPSAKPLPQPVYDVVNEPFTNAERLRRGLAPLRPKMKRALGVHAPGPVAPQPTEPAPPQPSGGGSTPNPGLDYEGIVQITDASDGKILGYVANRLTDHGQIGIDINYRNPLEVVFKGTRANQQPGNIEITNGDDNKAGKYLGAVANEWMTNGSIGTGQDAFAYVSRTDETKSGAGPMEVNNGVRGATGTVLKAESTSWVVANQFTGEIASTWTNANGQVVDTKLFYQKAATTLAFVADADAFKAAQPDAVEVKLTIIPKPFY